LQVKREGPGAGRSDDSSFIDKHVPAINFFTGFHADYHRPTDDWEKIDAKGVSRVAALALELAARLAARTDRPEFIAPKR
jgi:di/tripeptidase